MQSYLWIAIGGALGSILRFGCSEAAIALFGASFPWGTLIVNIVGSAVIGFYAAVAGPEGRLASTDLARQFVMVGICGGFTTFSAFSLQTLTLAQQGKLLLAGLNVVGSVVLCLLAVWLGHAAAMHLNGLKPV